MSQSTVQWKLSQQTESGTLVWGKGRQSRLTSQSRFVTQISVSYQAGLEVNVDCGILPQLKLLVAEAIASPFFPYLGRIGFPSWELVI